MESSRRLQSLHFIHQISSARLKMRQGSFEEPTILRQFTGSINHGYRRIFACGLELQECFIEYLAWIVLDG